MKQLHTDIAIIGAGLTGLTTAFWLTRAGLDWLGQELGITIYDEED